MSYGGYGGRGGGGYGGGYDRHERGGDRGYGSGGGGGGYSNGYVFCFVSFGHLDGSLDVSGFVQMGRVEDCQDAVVAPCFESFGTNVLAQLL